MEVLKTFPDGEKLIFTRGKFDDYMVVFLDTTGSFKSAQKDTEFFNFALSIGDNKKVWSSLLELSNSIHKQTNLDTLNIPAVIGSLDEYKMFLAYAAAMLAEEKRVNTKLGKRIKLLGFYQLLILNFKPEVAARWSVGKRWQEIDNECRKYGF